jgi:hypothetical protein
VLLVADQYVLLNRMHMHATAPACRGLPTSLAFTRLCAAKAEWTNPIPDNSPVALIGLGYTNYNRLRDPTVLQQVCGLAHPLWASQRLACPWQAEQQCVQLCSTHTLL